ncbi:hypothetical protein H112_08140 [Trichophyton rubrum D6]|uniref:Uncharacterized protein n=3 Tax=Trichophyton TaxID=5550 RepID=A0A080WDZ5_TRIRC|nr:uncharacterized protein TERG_11614 [Trichophyton rubrum CBS 118892]EZF10630.1 hypothetical protein H100_08167 [Trichophyton rubrum MR850]EZF37490.1 hypothetical protein H102_08124 [Trichophyton rubrum CBS 100081]EZF80066.1 hypothetical protein H110_08153 [Trichophyton rubrum MR1448]EZF90699.1 hypothetical protein H113_08215 [Trichophyton rubrum MR1459]EZG02001.1 hypothetical protein H106_08021 [Trichophyton rubrum CBS 735.88]KDB29249.1 hypothetical protein H112_08140 [Trichophyton rubrum D
MDSLFIMVSAVHTYIMYVHPSVALMQCPATAMQAKKLLERELSSLFFFLSNEPTNLTIKSFCFFFSVYQIVISCLSRFSFFSLSRVRHIHLDQMIITSRVNQSVSQVLLLDLTHSRLITLVIPVHIAVVEIVYLQGINALTTAATATTINSLGGLSNCPSSHFQC